MRTTIDAAGRVVVPKVLRDALGIAGPAEVEVSLVDGHLEIDVPTTPVRLERRGRGLVAITDVNMPELTSETVRDVLERTRR
ncbi:MAG: antitoxin [Thermoleophilaceae bacterium]|nr:antitoxin [Thermoleophilaceae bacterium]